MSGDQPIIAEIGATYARACGTLVSSPAGLWVLARALIRAGHDPARPIATFEDGAITSHGSLASVAAWSAPEDGKTGASEAPMRPSGEAATHAQPSEAAPEAPGAVA